MKNMTNSAWAAVFIFMACLLALASLFSHSSNATMVGTMASSIITGAFGYIQGKKDGASENERSVQVPVNPDSPSPSVTVGQQAQPNPKA